ncbi:MAG: hypothetical protein M1821_006019 [Bathelium mastoideum]|nr:MAG: hypothetical protein M1821_006019 [Bathelium mastoideum]
MSGATEQRLVMDYMARASALVAPLNIIKEEKNEDDVKPKEDQAITTIPTQQIHVVIPPLTPEEASQSPEPQQPAPPLVFHNFLRAFYSFHPESTISSSTEEESSITVPINVGDVILVHSVHPNGWADGTLLASGARGWIPTNYCQAYDHEYIRNLLSALTRVWDILRVSEFENDLRLLTKQDYVRGMIAAIRYFLGHVGLRRLRKGLLSDLSSFVKSTKQLQEIVGLQPAADELQDLLDELVLKAFKVVTRAVRFLDVWLEDVGAPDVMPGDQGRARPLTPPTEPIGEDSADLEAAKSSPPQLSGSHPKNDVAPSHNLSISSSPRWHGPGEDGVAENAPQRPSAREPGPASATDSLQPCEAATASQLGPLRRASVSHRLSYCLASGTLMQKSNLASEKLSAAQDAFLGYLGSFIGLHLQSRSSSELLVITQQSVAACRQLLVVVDEVWQRDLRRSETLEQAQNNMQDRLGDLVQATQDLFIPSDTVGVDHVLMPDQSKNLVAAATGCVRSAGDCVSKTRLVIEKIGDFEFETVGLGLSDTILNRLPSLAEGFFPEQPGSESIPENVSVVSSTKSSSRRPPPLYQSVSKPLPKTPLASPSSERSMPTISQTALSTIDLSENTSTFRPPLIIPTSTFTPDTTSQSPESNTKRLSAKESRAESIGVSVSSSNDTEPYSYRDSETSGVSTISTRATTPDQSPASHKDHENQLLSSFGSISDIQSSINEEAYDAESQILEKTYAHELIYNKEGQISGGSLPALIERLTTSDSTPDAMFVTSFYLTFRLFTTPVECTRVLIDRFEYVSDSKRMAKPVQLRVYNVFKGWLESHWQSDPDAEALPMILRFATGKLRAALPAAGRRLAELTAKVSEVHAGALVPRLVSSVGKANTSVGLYSDKDCQPPNPIITKSQLNALRNAKNGGNACSILDFDPLELARQFTIIESRIFCAIQSEELLGLEWTKKHHSKAVNVRAMSTLSTDLANLVADTILSVEDVKKRAIVIKQWVKIGMKCLELNNYDSLMAIICSLNSSMVQRLKRTWDLVSVKNSNRLEELKAIVDVSKNYAVLRQRLETEVAPCLPFVGIYLTDLTFVDVGNQTTRHLPGGGLNGEGAAVINFDKHMKTAKIIGQLQRFQVPYRLVAVPEMQDWMESQIRRVRASDETNLQQLYRRSLYLEPREGRPLVIRPGLPESSEATFPDSIRSGGGKDQGKDKFDFSRAFTFSSHGAKEKLAS